MGDLSYSRLLSVSSDDEKEFVTLEDLKAHQLTDLEQRSKDNLKLIEQKEEHDQSFNVYYDLNTHKPNSVSNLYQDMTIDTSFLPESDIALMDSSNSINTENLQNQYIQKSSRKRKFSLSEVSEDIEDDDAKSIKTTDDNKKANHSEIEKRRRDKMNNFITELSSMIPMCHAMSRKLDKLTVLRMAVQHLKTIRGTTNSFTADYKPAFLSDQELKMLILQAAEGFLFVVGCDRGRILYVSESVSEVLNYTQGELLGQSWFDILHPKDIAKVKEQLSSSDLSPRERLIDAKTMLPVKHSDVSIVTQNIFPGARRSFFCRMKCKSSVQIKEEIDSNNTTSNCHRRNKKQMADKKFVTIQSIGYLKSWAPAKILETSEQESEEGDCLSLSCLVAVGRLVDYNNDGSFQNIKTTISNNAKRGNPSLRNVHFISRHANDGKFLFVDQRATLVLGFLPQELLGTSMYEYFNHRDIAALADSHKVALTTTEKVTTPIYGMRTKDNGFINIQSEWKSFKNPWTRDIEFLIAKNNVIFSDLRNYENGNQIRNNGNESSYDFLNQTNGREMTRMINVHIEASKIGRQIAEQVLDYQRRMGDDASPDSSSSDPDPTLAMSLADEGNHLASMNVENNSNSAASNDMPTRINGTYSNFATFNHDRSSVENGTNEVTTGDGNDDASMAVLMNLLEADAGLGGPIDFTGLPWPLP
ncbi:hypothetical protein PVAND_005526 [Polypedilum vanderplanki]|uniref:Cycle n=1 Tax=Polypedilum vanderplanki TaxID=319348 RepID=A0A9J6C2B9_POLVA|nr:hypothetical protein PVAND_005526 [Polypedilum vanderplanki]